MWLFLLLLLKSLIGFAFSKEAYGRIHQENVVKVKCESLPFRSYYEGAKCYFAVSMPVSLNHGSALCHSALAGAALDITPASRQALNVMFLHAKERCSSLENSKLVSITNDDENTALASFIVDNGGAWIDQPLLEHKPGTETTENSLYFRWFRGQRCLGNNAVNILATKKGSCTKFGYWQQIPTFQSSHAFCARPSDGDFFPVQKKPVQEQITTTTSTTTTTTTTKPTTTKQECPLEDLRLTPSLFTRLGRTMPGGVITDGKIKAIAFDQIERAMKKCACGEAHMSYAAYQLLNTPYTNAAVQYKLSPAFLRDGKPDFAYTPSATTTVFGIMKEVPAGTCGATVAVYKRYGSKGEKYVNTTKQSAGDVPAYYTWS